ncbi:MAG: DUF4142 domain-containing protein [Gemmatimonadota bacterium]|nr:DUF4142 domain-containing protein [Gemmatimonadota bacterium]
MTKIARAAAMALVAGALAACAKKDAAADHNSAVAARASVAGTSATPSALTDANILAILDAANASDSAWGAIAAVKGTSADIRNFGKTTMRDHHALRQAGQELAKKLGVAAQLPAGDNSAAELQKYVDLFNNTAKGKEFDRAYIEHEVAYHKQVLATAVRAMPASQSTELKNLIQKAAPSIQSHLDAAEAIQQKMR